MNKRETAERGPLADPGRLDYHGLRVRNKHVPKSLRTSVELFVHALTTVLSASRTAFLMTMVLTLLAAVVPIGQVLAVMWLLDALLDAAGAVRVGTLLPLLTALALLTACSFGLAAVCAQLQRRISAAVMRDTQRRILDITTTVALDTYETPWFFNWVARVEANALTKPAEIAQSLVTIAAGAFAGIGLAIVVVVIDPVLLPLLAVTMVPSWVAGRKAGKAEFDFAVRQSAGIRERNYLTVLLKMREAAKDIRAFELAGLLLGRWRRRYDGYLGGLRDLTRKRMVAAACAAVLTGGLLLVATVLLLLRMQAGYISLAEAGAALIAMRMLTARLQTAASGGNKLYEAQLFLGDLRDFLALGERCPDSTSAEARQPVSQLGHSRLVVDGISYRYPGSDRLVLDDVSLEIEKGEVIALVGENGSGKTTLAKILAGLNRPTSGEVYWDGHATSGMDLMSVRKRVSPLFQDFTRFELSAMDNIAAGRTSDAVDVEAVHRAAERAGASEFLESLPHGYETVLGKMLPHSTDLSVGQWQRIALARTIYRDAEFVVLDEPTSALDPRAEHELFARIREMFHGRTVLLISHRFSSTRVADRIYVLDSGRIVQSGAHDELMRHGGAYRELFTLQAAAY